MTGNNDIDVQLVLQSLLAGRDPPRPLTVQVSGAKGAMGRIHNAPFFRRKGAEVWRSDIAYNPSAHLDNTTVAKRRPDILNVSVRPFRRTWEVVAEVAEYLPRGGLVLVSPSVQIPRGEAPEHLIKALRSRGVDVGFMHLMFGPGVDSWQEQSVMYGFAEPLLNPDWQKLLERWLLEEGVRLRHGTFRTHDHASAFTQVHPMWQALESAAIWSLTELSLEEYIELMGPPGWFPAYGQIAALRQPELITEIVTFHPESIRIMDSKIAFYTAARELVLANDQEGLKELVPKLRISEERRLEILSHYNQLVRAEADFRGGAHAFLLNRKQNYVGAAAKILHEYDSREVEKETTGIQSRRRHSTAVMYIKPFVHSEKEAIAAEDARKAVIEKGLAKALPPNRKQSGGVDNTFYLPD